MIRAFCCVLCLTTTVQAHPAEVIGVEARQAVGGWMFNVTVAHEDTGWDHYADGWRVVSTDGTELGMRVLHHPHVEEQPFTRRLSGVILPEGTTEVLIEVRDNVSGWSPVQVPVTLD